MFLKRLELQGFKTFANRTEIDFSAGMTCVVGPNGSGKSNVADALRWVLGEQSMRALRCKKVEDVIFAGGAGRPPAGMAEVSITFDNATGWLDTPFQEVVVTRRAYRSGESEYLINRDRVRLRDVVDLLLKANVSPNGYTVIGQGMVDLALSLKPEERRELFEDAAGIRHHYVRLNEARNRLGTTEANLSRVRDVVAEIEPRLKQLERRAKQLRERDSVRAELRAHLAAWYGHRWLVLRAEADEAERAEKDAAQALASARTTADETAEQAGDILRRQNALRGRLTEIERAKQALVAQGERIERELALRRERAGSARGRAAELRAEIEGLEARMRADDAAARSAESQIARLEADVAGLAAELAAAEGATEDHRDRSEALRRQLQQAVAVAERFRAEQATIRSELGKIAPRREELRREMARAAQAAQTDEERVTAAQAAIDRDRAALADLQAAAEEREREAERLRDELTACRRTQEAIAVKLAETARERATVQGRLDLLTDVREGYAGYYQGVRAVLAAARAPRPGASRPGAAPHGAPPRGAAVLGTPTPGAPGAGPGAGTGAVTLGAAVPGARGPGEQGRSPAQRGPGGAKPPAQTSTPSPTAVGEGAGGEGSSQPQLQGIVGLVASLIRVPGELETAIEVALGAHLQDVVVERWEHAEAAVDLLKRTRAGRATFLPLDTIRGGSPTGAPVTGPGVRGAATHLVEFDERYRAVAEQLLGRTLIVDDLPVARRVLRDVGGGWQIVTLAGEVVRSNGAITGGSNQGAGDRTLLARERERRELPQRLAAIATSGQSLEDELAAQRARQMEIEAAQRTLQTEQRAGAEAVTRAREAVAAATGRIERLGREVEWSRESVGRFETELAALDAREVALRERLATVPADGDEHERTIAALQSRLTELDHLTREQSQRVIAFRNNVAVIEGERRAQTRLLEGHAERRARVVDEMEARRRRIDELTGSAATFVEEAEELEAARGALDDQRQSLTGESEPLQGELSTLAEQLRLIQSGEAAGRAQLNEMADQVRAVAIQAQSARDHLHSLLREAATELAELAPTESPLPLGEGQGEGVPGDGGSATDLDPREDQGVDRPPTHSQASLDDAAPELVYEPLTAPEATWRRIELLRSRLRMIGAVDASAGQEYDETLARHAFLSGQAADLIDASRVLKEAIAELETTMQARFEETFAAVAVAFKQHFTALFGGGTARLVLAENESGGVPGVEIIAQPPGKRAQSLSLLSGGERALTAVAILFAILEVNPTPVCMLDEVDAALDDANVMRFGQTLRRLAERTQFVVITHNRGTMEAADALYGVSMLDRSTSRTVSLKLVDIPA